MEIISRATWGALKQAQLEWRAWPASPPVVVHHTVSPPPPRDASERQEAGIMAGFDRHHYYTNGWRGGIGYSYVIFPSGRVYEGRGKDTRGAHSPDANHLPGVALVGDYSSVIPTADAMLALGTLAHKLGAEVLRGHRDYYPTSCPGDKLYAQLDSIQIGPGYEVKPELPYGSSLRLSLNGTTYAGWKDVGPRLNWIARHGLKSGSEAAIAWRGNVWRGPVAVTNVARNLVRRYLDKEN